MVCFPKGPRGQSTLLLVVGDFNSANEDWLVKPNMHPNWVWSVCRLTYSQRVSKSRPPTSSHLLKGQKLSQKLNIKPKYNGSLSRLKFMPANTFPERAFPFKILHTTPADYVSVNYWIKNDNVTTLKSYFQPPFRGSYTHCIQFLRECQEIKNY